MSSTCFGIATGRLSSRLDCKAQVEETWLVMQDSTNFRGFKSFGKREDSCWVGCKTKSEADNDSSYRMASQVRS